MAKKITRKELLKEPDEFLTFSAKMMQFFTEYRIQILAGLGTLFAVVIIASGIRYFSNKAENDAFAAMRDNMSKYEDLMKDNDPKKAYQGIKDSFDSFLSQYSGRTAGKLARAMFANICYDAGEIKKAIELYEKALADFTYDPSLKAMILNGLGYAYEADKNYDKALSSFERIVSEPDAPMKGESLFNVARLYAQKGDAAKSAEAYKKITAEYGDSVYIQIAKEKTSG